mmetsp:Transcript_25414/g.51010  ORF Transcript_25414/g.51010 Transcript_25414/m.51010 type:complete len:203 (-) Transcript_25414:937-1545(-)
MRCRSSASEIPAVDSPKEEPIFWSPACDFGRPLLSRYSPLPSPFSISSSSSSPSSSSTSSSSSSLSFSSSSALNELLPGCAAPRISASSVCAQAPAVKSERVAVLRWHGDSNGIRARRAALIDGRSVEDSRGLRARTESKSDRNVCAPLSSCFLIITSDNFDRSSDPSFHDILPAPRPASRFPVGAKDPSFCSLSVWKTIWF